MKHLYFAYGMNLDPANMEGCEPVCAARLEGWELRFSYYADIQPSCGEAHVDGGLWIVDDEALRTLDTREGYPGFYDRKEVDVSAGGCVVKAIVYFMRERQPLRPPGPGYLSTIEFGYTYFRLPRKPLHDAVDRACQ